MKIVNYYTAFIGMFAYFYMISILKPVRGNKALIPTYLISALLEATFINNRSYMPEILIKAIVLLVWFFAAKLITHENFTEIMFILITYILIEALSKITITAIFNYMSRFFFIESETSVIKTSVFIFKILIFYLMKRIKSLNEIKFHNKRSVLVKSFIGVLISINISLILFLKFSQNSTLQLMILVLLLGFTYYICITVIHNIEQNCIEQNEINKAQELYIKKLEDILYGYREMKHGFNNHLFALSGYMKNGDYDGLKVYLSPFIQKSTNILQNEHVSLLKIKNYALFGLIIEKVELIKRENIILSILILQEINFKGLKVEEVMDLCFILGNFLDNAIFAAKQISKPFILIEMKQQKQNINILIKNSFDNENLGKLDVEADSGYGLKLVKKKISKYDFMLNNQYIEDDKVYTQELIIVLPSCKTE